MEGREIVALSAALIAALLAVAKLIADKETKISDFRKDWINTFRAALSEMLGEAYSISGRIKIRVKHAEDAKKEAAVSAAGMAAVPTVEPPELAVAADQDAVACAEDVQPRAVSSTVSGGANASPGTSKKIDPKLLTQDEIKALEDELTDHWNTLRKAHRTVLLHLNFSETVWGGYPYEQGVTPRSKADAAWQRLVRSSRLAKGLAVTAPYSSLQNGQPSEAAVLLVAQLDHLVEFLLGKYYEVGTDDRYEAIKQAIDNSTLLGNLVLKPEWNRIKEGEPKYNQLLVFLAGVVIIGAFALGLVALAPTKPVSSPPANQIMIDLGATDVTRQQVCTGAREVLQAQARTDSRWRPEYKDCESPQ